MGVARTEIPCGRARETRNKISYLCQYFPSPPWQLVALADIPLGVFVFVRNNYEYAVAVVPGLRRNVDDIGGFSGLHRNVDDIGGFYLIFPAVGGFRNSVCLLRNDASEIESVVASLSVSFTDRTGFTNFMHRLRRLMWAVMRPNSLGIYTDTTFPGHYPSDEIAPGEADLSGAPSPQQMPSHEKPISRKRARAITPPPPMQSAPSTTSQPTSSSTTTASTAMAKTIVDDNDEGSLCCFCKIEPLDTIMLPCMHRVLCMVCARKYAVGMPMRCLVCRDRVEHMICPDNSVITFAHS